MQKIFFFLAFAMLCACSPKLAPSANTADVRAFQQKLNSEYQNPKESPLSKEALKTFKGHDFFPIDAKYCINATFIRTEKEKSFGMPTTTKRLAQHVKYGEIQFTIDGKLHRLNVYQSLDLMTNPEYKDYLFLPFGDNTNGSTTYGGGRFIDLKIPAGDKITVDFNKAYNPYCVYSDKYSCPIVPKENRLDAEINAGVKMTAEH
jgi:uncharacterized protein